MLIFKMALVIKYYVQFAFLFVHTVYQFHSLRLECQPLRAWCLNDVHRSVLPLIVIRGPWKQRRVIPVSSASHGSQFNKSGLNIKQIYKYSTVDGTRELGNINSC